MFINVTWPNHGIAQLKLDRDYKRNALSVRGLHELEEALAGAVLQGARAIIVTGAGACFSAGADLSAGDPTAIYPALMRVTAHITCLPVAVVAYVNGPAIGAGAVLAAACDIRVVDAAATFSVPVARMGVRIDRQFASALADLVGGSRARTMLLTGSELSAHQAVECGFASGSGAIEYAYEIAQLCAQGDAGAVAAVKEAFSGQG